MDKKTKQLWKKLNNFYNLDYMEQASLIAELMVFLEESNNHGGLLKWLRGRFAKALTRKRCKGSNPLPSAKKMYFITEQEGWRYEGEKIRKNNGMLNYRIKATPAPIIRELSMKKINILGYPVSEQYEIGFAFACRKIKQEFEGKTKTEEL